MRFIGLDFDDGGLLVAKTQHRAPASDLAQGGVIDDLSTGGGLIGNFEVGQITGNLVIYRLTILKAEKGMHIQGAAYVLSDRPLAGAARES
ncbi:hypothetical protein K0M31_012990 [Melipona bicolor]|uniref:Uncharacterized protein n=1 Tax=Melipona bicolor TaxID=60889 RepID=A0AA40FJC2_9HYME|nr:hypothetical protein K0M31_012990 [Melipona bicolor]